MLSDSQPPPPFALPMPLPVSPVAPAAAGKLGTCHSCSGTQIQFSSVHAIHPNESKGKDESLGGAHPNERVVAASGQSAAFAPVAAGALVRLVRREIHEQSPLLQVESSRVHKTHHMDATGAKEKRNGRRSFVQSGRRTLQS